MTPATGADASPPTLRPEAARVHRFTAGEALPVPIDAIEGELRALWTEAGHAAWADGAQVLSRAALWNLVLPVSNDEEVAAVKHLVDELTPSVPARVIVLHQPGGAGGAGREVEATIATNVVSRPDGHVVSSEEITITAHGAGAEHLPALVRSLLVADLPTAVLWLGHMPARRRLTWELLAAADRFAVDTGVCRADRELHDVEQLRRLAPAEMCDLGWLRLTNLRLLFASLFGPPVGGRPLLEANSVIIRHREGRAASALLLAGWLAAQNRWADPELVERPRAGRRRYRVHAEDGRAVAIDVVCEEGDCGPSGVTALELASAQGAFTLRRLPNHHAELTLPIAPPQVVKLDPPTEGQLILTALRGRAHDPVYARALEHVATLCNLSGAAP